MASRPAIAAALKLMARAFAGVVDEARVDVYFAALEDLSDADVQRATVAVIRTHTGDFIPVPAVLRKAVAPAQPAIDADAILARVAQLGTYSANVGMIWPTTAVVDAQLGEVIGYAYAAAGGPRVFSDNDVTRDIARRDFAQALKIAATRPAATALPVIDARALPAACNSDAAKVRGLIAGVADKLRIDRGAA